jgi:hypothetical protein
VLTVSRVKNLTYASDIMVVIVGKGKKKVKKSKIEGYQDIR